jgi:hypothetical protein
MPTLGKNLQVYYSQLLTAFWTPSFVTRGDDFLEA